MEFSLPNAAAASAVLCADERNEDIARDLSAMEAKNPGLTKKNTGNKTQDQVLALLRVDISSVDMRPYHPPPTRSRTYRVPVRGTRLSLKSRATRT